LSFTGEISDKHKVLDNKCGTFYVIGAIDVITRIVFPYACTRYTVICARDFLLKLNQIFGILDSEAHLQRDDGTEFMGEFEEAAKKFGINLITNYARCHLKDRVS